MDTVSEILTDKLLIFNKNQSKREEIKVKITLDDNLNHKQYLDHLDLEQCSFL